MSATVLDANLTADAEAEELATSMIEVSKLTRDLLAIHLTTIALSPGEDDHMLALRTPEPTNLCEAGEDSVSLTWRRRRTTSYWPSATSFNRGRSGHDDGIRQSHALADLFDLSHGGRGHCRTAQRRPLDGVRRALDDVKKNMIAACKRRSTCQ